MQATDRRPRGRFEPLEDRCLLSITPELIKDINTTEAGSWPHELTEMEGVAYFSASAGLWRSDGTSEGTRRIANVETWLDGFAVVGQQLYFVGYEPVYGTELWVTDGTDAGTRLVKDILPGWQSTSFSELTAVGEALFFVATDPEAGSELWRSDGTEAGTHRVRDIRPGLEGSSPTQLFDFLGQIAFIADDGEHGREIWLSDGTAEGTRLLADIYEGSGSSDPDTFLSSRFFAIFQDSLFFVARDRSSNGVWQFDGRANMARPVSPASSAQLIAAPDYLLIAFTDWQSGLVLSRFDGRDLVTLLELSAASFDALRNPCVFEGRVYFTIEGPPQNELWSTNGTASGTTLATTFERPGRLIAAEGQLFHLVRYAGTVELWSSDGTDQGTVLLQKIFGKQADHGVYQHREVAVGNNLFFVADDGETGPELWCSDGTSDGTRLVANLALQSDGSIALGKPVRVGNLLFFAANDGVTFIALWRTDGTPDGTIKLTGLNGDLGGSMSQFTSLGGVLYFIRPERGSHELWRSDGTVVGTFRIHRFAAGFSANTYARLTAAGEHLFFFDSEPSTGMELWTSDGTEAGTRIVKDVRPGPLSSNDAVSGIVAAELGVVYFVADDGVSGPELWRSDGTAEGTRLVVDLREGSRGSSVTELASWRDRVYFLTDVGGQTGLWSTNGTAEGTALIVEVDSGASPWYPRDFTPAGDYLFLLAEDSEFQSVLWRTDGTTAGTVPVRSIGLPGRNARVHGEVLAMGGELYFLGDDGISGEELWRSDGSAEGTRLVADIAPGSASAYIRGLTDINEALFFGANSPTGFTLWRSNGTPGGTTSLGVEIFDDHVSGLGRSVIVSTSSGLVGYEPHALTPPPGDTNYDGLVDLTDFGRLKATFGAAGDSLAADFDVSGVVDLGDFGLLKENFGRAGGLAAQARTAIAEPSPAASASSATRFEGNTAPQAGSFSREDWIEAVAYQLAWTLVAREQTSAAID